MDIKRQDIINCVKSPHLSFEDKAFRLFEYQQSENPVYRQFLEIIGKTQISPTSIHDIPFCPIGLFKDRVIKSGNWNTEQIFLSSGTTSMSRSQHHIRDATWYLKNTEHIWKEHFSPLSDYIFLSLLPNYQSNSSSSLLKMVGHFMRHSKDGEDRYFIEDDMALAKFLNVHKNDGTPIVLFGVSFALLDYCSLHRHEGLDQVFVIETGGMKKYKKEITREALHKALSLCFGGATICSEYGMTECLSQLYAVDSGYFAQNERMKVVITEATDPFCAVNNGTKGRINLIDLANIDTIAFIATDDLGCINENEQLEVLGRIDSTDLRGCNYLI